MIGNIRVMGALRAAGSRLRGEGGGGEIHGPEHQPAEAKSTAPLVTTRRTSARFKARSRGVMGTRSRGMQARRREFERVVTGWRGIHLVLDLRLKK